MEANKSSLLADLALIYIAMAHGTDADLEQSEVDAIAEKLQAWQKEENTETVLSALKGAIEEYSVDDALPAVEAAIADVREKLPKERRQAIVDDLMEIGMADDKFLYEEGTFIADLAAAWDVHLEEGSAENGSWSILSSNGEEGWGTVQDLALVYLTLAHRTDDDLSTEEVGAISEKLMEWLPDAGEDQILNIVQDAAAVYAQGPDDRIFEDAVSHLGKAVPAHQRSAILEDLQYVAESDGEVLEEEAELIEELARAWDIDRTA